VELATVAEAKAGIDALRALTPASAQAAILGWLLTQDGAGSALDADLLDGQHGAWYADINGRLGYIPWGPNNDGAGSGLDAGLLAGQLPSFYTDVIARLGFTPLDKAGGAMTGPLTLAANPTAALGAVPKQYVDGLVTAAALLAKLLTVDGSGSGLDADLLDGQDGSWYSNIIARLGFTPLNKGGDTVTGALGVVGDLTLSNAGNTGFLNRPNVAGKKYLTISAQGGGPLEGLNIYSDVIAFNGATPWHTGNDGSGSGLDADLLDGRHASDFALLADFTRSLADNGWQKLPNGLVMQWARVTTTGTFSFPMTFPNRCFVVVAGNADAQGSYNDNAFAYAVSNSQFYAGAKSSINQNSYTSYAAHIVAIGN